MKNHLLLIASLVVLTALPACPKNIPPPEGMIEEPSKLRSAIDARLDSFESARFKEVVLDYFGKRERVKVRQLILVEAPDKVRVQTRVPGSNEIVSLLVTDGETFAMHRRDTNEYLSGRPTPDNINRLLPVDLSARDVVRVMFGGAPWDRFEGEPGEPKLRWDRRTGRYEYSVETTEGGRLAMQVRPSDYAVVSVTEYGPDGGEAYSYETDEWRQFGDRMLPTWRRFVWPERDLDFSVDVGKTEVDITLPNHLFQLEPPPGSTIMRLND
jgi:outer membrane lipoprotein-sorting protein